MDNILHWIDELGLQVRFANSRNDLKIPGLHIINPSSVDLMNACYEALQLECTIIIIYVREL